MTVTLNRMGLNHLYISPTGPVMQHLYRKGQQVLAEAQRNCPVHLGELQQSLKVAITAHGIGNKVEVGSDHKELIYVEEGTGLGHEPNAHAPYFPNWHNPRFAFWAEDHGGSAFGLALHIHLHGTKATHFMKDALRSAF